MVLRRGDCAYGVGWVIYLDEPRATGCAIATDAASERWSRLCKRQSRVEERNDRQVGGEVR